MLGLLFGHRVATIRATTTTARVLSKRVVLPSFLCGPSTHLHSLPRATFASVASPSSPPSSAASRPPPPPPKAPPKPPAFPPSKSGEFTLYLSDSCIARIKQIAKASASAATTPSAGGKPYLRIKVDAGGCSGFQYSFEIDKQGPVEGDQVFERNDVAVLVDDISMAFVNGATIDYKSELIRSSFLIAANPNADMACGCGASFAKK